MSNSKRSLLILRSSPSSARSRQRFGSTLRLRLALHEVDCLESDLADQSGGASATSRAVLSDKCEACAENLCAILQLRLRHDWLAVRFRIGATGRRYGF